MTELFLRWAGETPLRVSTPRGGEHWYYRDPEGAFVGVNHPNGLPYDIKGAGGGDLVLLPGSRSEALGSSYEIVCEAACHSPQAFAALLARVPPLPVRAYRELAGHASGAVAVHRGVIRLSPGRSVSEGQRNDTLFRWCCREAHAFSKASMSPNAGLAELTSRALGLNSAMFEPPLSAAEVAKTARSAWKATLAGANRRPSRLRLPIAEALVQLGGNAKALTLRLYFSQLDEPDHIRFSPSRWANAGVIPTWTLANYRAAGLALQKAGDVTVIVDGSRGRGRVGQWAVRAIRSPLPISPVLAQLAGDADAMILYLHVVERWGVGGIATLAVRAMVSGFGGPFSKWPEPRLRRARKFLVDRSLLRQLPARRRGNGFHEPARFRVEAPSVLKMAENAPQVIHPRAAVEDESRRKDCG